MTNSPLPRVEQTSPVEALATAQNEYGSMSLRPLDERLEMFATSRDSAEITNFYLEDSPQALMAGQVLLSNIEKQAREQGIREILVTSGPGAKKTAIAFWNRTLGPHIATSENHFGINEDTLVWRRLIAKD